uniref:Glycine zipper domain-containing protein n=1 Tax=Meloidogyne floridensis TaxID=298350 RepID=A0A915PG17_9BILA
MSGLDNDYDDQKLKNERKLTEHYQKRTNSEITQAANDELRNILEKEMSELHERERKLDDGNKKSTFWGTLWKVAEKVKEGFFEKTRHHNSDENDGRGENVENRENDTTNQPEEEIENVLERLSNIGNDNFKHQEELLSQEKISSKTSPSAQNENDDQLLYESKMSELDQITTNNDIRKAIVQEERYFQLRQKAEIVEKLKKLANKNKSSLWSYVCKVAQGAKELLIEKTSVHLDFSAGCGEYVENRENDSTKQLEPEIGNIKDSLRKIENDSFKNQEKLRITTTIETSKQINDEVNDFQHKENVQINDLGIQGEANLNDRNMLNEADELLKSAKADEKKIEEDERFTQQNQEKLNIEGAKIDKTEQEKNQPGFVNKIIKVGKTCKEHISDTFKKCYNYFEKTFSRETLFMGMKQRTRHRMPKKEGEPNVSSNDEPNLNEETRSNDIPRNTGQSGSNDYANYGPQNHSKSFRTVVIGTTIAGAAVGAGVGYAVAGRAGALVGGVVGAVTGAVAGSVIYASHVVVKTCEAVISACKAIEVVCHVIASSLNEVKKAASNYCNKAKEGVKNAWNWAKGCVFASKSNDFIGPWLTLSIIGGEG